MGIGKRISQIFRANMNDLLSSAEDPAKQMDLALSDMQDALKQAKQILVQQLAEEKRLQRELDQADEMARVWEDKARKAVEAGADDLAREALRKKRTYGDLAGQLDGQLADQQKSVDDLRAQYKMLEQRIAEAQDRRKQITREVYRRRNERPAEEGPRAVDTTLLRDRSAFDKFEEMADKVTRFEAETDARRELDTYLEGEDRLAAQIDSLGGGSSARSDRRQADERDLSVDIELQAMRQRMGRDAAPVVPATPPPPADPGESLEPERHERRSHRREAAKPIDAAAADPATADPATAESPRPKPDDEPDEGGDGDDGNWGRRVEL